MYKRKDELAGYVGQTPVLHQTGNGTQFTILSVCVKQRKGIAKDAPIEDTWYKISVWGNNAIAVVNNITKGDNVFVEGKWKLNEGRDQNGNATVDMILNANKIYKIQELKYASPKPTTQTQSRVVQQVSQPVQVAQPIQQTQQPVVRPVQPIEPDGLPEFNDDEDLPF